MIDKTSECNLFETCEAPLCPLQKNSIKHGVWYGDEEICRARKFQSLSWVKKQKRIARLGLTGDDGFFSIKMLDAIHTITRSIRGADPDHFDSDKTWLKQRGLKRARANQKRRNLTPGKMKKSGIRRLRRVVSKRGAANLPSVAANP